MGAGRFIYKDLRRDSVKDFTPVKTLEPAAVLAGGQRQVRRSTALAELTEISGVEERPYDPMAGR